MFASFGSSVLAGAQYFNGQSSTKVRYSLSLYSISLSWRSLKQGPSTSAIKAIPRVFKGPALATNPSYTTSATFDVGYVPMPNSDPRQVRSTGYFQEPEVNRPPVTTRDTTKRSSYHPSSNIRPQEDSRPPRVRTSSFAITPSISQHAYVYERSVSSKSDLHADSDEESDGEDVPESPSSVSSVTTNLSTAFTPNISATSRSRLEVLENMPSIPVGHIVPPTFDPPSIVVDPTLGRNSSNSSSSSNKASWRKLPTPPKSDSSSGSDTITSADGYGAEERVVRPRVVSNAAASRDSAIYPLPSGYTGLAGAAPGGPRVANPEPELRGVPSRITNRDGGEQLGDSSVYFSQPPGLETYANDPSRPPGFVPHRRHSEGEQTASMPNFSSTPAVIPQLRPSSAPPSRNVRWNENLICPSPILSSQRRKGWFNRRG